MENAFLFKSEDFHVFYLNFIRQNTVGIANEMSI